MDLDGGDGGSLLGFCSCFTIKFLDVFLFLGFCYQIRLIGFPFDVFFK